EAGRRDHVHAAALRDGGELLDVPAGVAGHAVDHRAAAGGLEVAQLADAVLDRGQEDVGRELGRVALVDDDVFVRVTAAQLTGRDVTEHRADEAHRFPLAVARGPWPQAKSQAWAAAPRTPAWSVIFET